MSIYFLKAFLKVKNEQSKFIRKKNKNLKNSCSTIIIYNYEMNSAQKPMNIRYSQV